MQSTRYCEVASLIHRDSPYADFDYEKMPYQTVPEWHGGRLFLSEMVETVQPGLIIEVGSWKGDSAINMASALRNSGMVNSGIVCVDTWLGALEFWVDHCQREHYAGLELRNGYPQVYYRFLANICHQSLQGFVTPFPQTSEIAALFFKYYGVHADLIYIDASHEDEFVYRDIAAYRELLTDDGVMFGDDYVSVDGVRTAVDRYARDHNLVVRCVDEFWILDGEIYNDESLPQSIASAS